MLIFTMALEHKHSFHRDMVFDIKDKITKLLEEQENRTIEWEKLFVLFRLAKISEYRINVNEKIDNLTSPILKTSHKKNF